MRDLIIAGVLAVLWLALFIDDQMDKSDWERAHHCAVTDTTGPGPYETNPRIETLTCDGGVKTWRYAR